MDCRFCNIISLRTEEIIHESAQVFAVLSNPRLVRGHLLVIPKRHVEKFSELSVDERQELFDEAIRLEEKILEHFASGCDMTQHFRPFIVENRLKVSHLHIHLRPREFEDQLYQKAQKHEADLFTSLEEGEAAKYKKFLS